MASFNKVIIMGRLTADPEAKQTQSGTAVTSFTLAVDRRYNSGEDKKCDFITVVAWKNTAEFICRYFKKGQAMLVCGELQTRSWEDSKGNKRYATEVVAVEVSFCESKKESEGTSYSSNQNGSWGNSAAPAPKFEEVKSDEDLPF